MDAPEPAAEWSTPKTDQTTGVALHNDYPYNSRLRAEAMARDGVTTDPDGLIDDALIADAAERLIAEDAEAERIARQETPSMAWTRDRLVAHAATIPGLHLEGDANKAAILAAIEAAPTAAKTEG